MPVFETGMRRRAVIGGLAAAVLFPRGPKAQKAGRIVGVLVGQGTRTQGQWRIDVLTAGLKSLGWFDGQNLHLEFRWPEGDGGRAARDAAELVGLGSDVLLATNTFATTALMAATATTPIVFINVTDPLGSGLVSSFARPGGNVTGFTDMDPAIAGKWVELLRELIPTTRTVVMIYNPETEGPFVSAYRRAFDSAARQLGLDTRIEHVRAVGDYEAVFQRCSLASRCAAIMLDDALFALNAATLVPLATRAKTPVMYTLPGYAIRDGGLIGYNVHLPDLYTQAARYVDRILRGERPGELPVQMPVSFRLAVNRTVATAIGIEVPPSILARADQVIE